MSRSGRRVSRKPVSMVTKKVVTEIKVELNASERAVSVIQAYQADKGSVPSEYATLIEEFTASIEKLALHEERRVSLENKLQAVEDLKAEIALLEDQLV